jgi:hypothetical protein
MNKNRPTQAKVLLHGEGVGSISVEDIQRRARELASINGVPPAVVTDEFLEQARRELQGEELPAGSTEDAEAVGGITRDPSEPPSDTGRQIPNLEESDGQQDQERLTEEGVEEAQHDQMLAARRLERHEDRSL